MRVILIELLKLSFHVVYARWRICFWVSTVPAGILALSMMFCAESPHWLYKVCSHSHRLCCQSMYLIHLYISPTEKEKCRDLLKIFELFYVNFITLYSLLNFFPFALRNTVKYAQLQQHDIKSLKTKLSLWVFVLKEHAHSFLLIYAARKNCWSWSWVWEAFRWSTCQICNARVIQIRQRGWFRWCAFLRIALWSMF